MNQVLGSLFEITITLYKANINIFIKFNGVQNQDHRFSKLSHETLIDLI
jgi:hypothetical protein